MALGVNYGAFSMTFSASLAGIMWRDVLSKQNIRVQRLEFARVNLPLIAVAMTISCVVLVGEVYIVRDNSPYSL
jgi:Na+/H+ antiporter NhaD/arsenite permease-like protein